MKVDAMQAFINTVAIFGVDLITYNFSEAFATVLYLAADPFTTDDGCTCTADDEKTNNERFFGLYIKPRGRRGGVMVSALVPGARGPGHCVVFLGKTLNSRSASLHPGV